MSDQPSTLLSAFSRKAHAAHCKLCLSGLPASQIDVDGSRLALAFYCLGGLDLLGVLEEEISPRNREEWRTWLWTQHAKGKYGSGFRPGPFMTGRDPRISLQDPADYTNYDTPHLIMTYTALLSLAILRDDFSKLDRKGIIAFLRCCQRQDGSFSTVPGSNENDLRTLYCAFAISNMLDDWSGVDIPQAVAFLATCRTYEGGYGQSTFCEGQGGTTYTAIAALGLASAVTKKEYLTRSEKQVTIEWLLRNQDDSGGFRGRTGKEADACYCFWCGGSLKILGAESLVNSEALATYLSRCRFKYGGIAKAPGESPDPYHTYLSLAALSMYPPQVHDGNSTSETWKFGVLDPLLNAREETVAWIRSHVPDRKVHS
ncbi:terpenoid cyclases/protein prenyltransferase alpha-alpha toroid [Crepidotus variabilis]|uniref:Terpenoid cyclases/protein prenyltransferase alpha-alpha toroid n=1 Tax=Crepidotus variabilis TaxID=179855 RepID=A0A9P6EQA0_9AGAR|nr:terpenoid cyclases/protein prenyltransferase alpha-alpha toroid [Crepidotus variabilis]